MVGLFTFTVTLLLPLPNSKNARTYIIVFSPPKKHDDLNTLPVRTAPTISGEIPSMSFWAVRVAHVAVLADHRLGLGWWILGVRPSLESAELLAEAEVLQLQPGDPLDGRRCLDLASVQLSGERGAHECPGVHAGLELADVEVGGGDGRDEDPLALFCEGSERHCLGWGLRGWWSWRGIVIVGVGKSYGRNVLIKVDVSELVN